jgi:MoaA/NifB/PqqE/SkfB family radical SAM enzyme
MTRLKIIFPIYREGDIRMFVTETYSVEFTERYLIEQIEKFKRKKLVILTVCEQGIYFLELLRSHGVEALAFADVNEKVIGKTICGIPVMTYDEIPMDAFIVVSSAATAYHDRDELIRKGYGKEQIITLYPVVIEYFREEFEEIDRKQYRDLTKNQNDQYITEEMRGEIEVRSLPTMLILDLTTRCNLNCRHCEAHHDKDVSKIRNREENYINPSRYKFLFDYANTIYLNISGEPLMSPDFWTLLDYIDSSENDPNLFTVTNGILLNKNAADRIVNSKFKEIFISMDAATKKTYSRLRGGDFDVWFNNVKYLVESRNKAGKKLRIVLQHTISREALEETEAAIQMAEDLGVDEISIRPLYTDIAGKENWIVPMDEERIYYYPQQDAKYYPKLTKTILERSKKLAETCKTHVEISGRFEANLSMDMEDFPYPCSVEQFKELLKENESVLREKTIEEVPEEAKEFSLCDGPWNLAMIFTNGNIMYCNRMAQAEGNINFSSIFELRNSKTVQDIRKGLIDDDLSWHCYYCSGCARSDYSKHLRREKEVLRRGEVLNFSIDDTAALKKVKYHGLSRIQRNGTWNNLDQSSVELYLAKDGSPYRITINAEAFVIPGLIDRQTVEVFVNDVLSDTWNYVDDMVSDRTIQINEKDIPEDGKIALRLRYPQAVSPLSLGIGRDDRARSVFIHSITVK